MSANTYTKPARFQSVLDEPRVRFNWGFWDAVNDVKRGQPERDMSDHFDPHYAVGYSRGWIAQHATNFALTSSDEAWQAYTVWAHETNPQLAAELVGVWESFEGCEA